MLGRRKSAEGALVYYEICFESMDDERRPTNHWYRGDRGYYGLSACSKYGYIKHADKDMELGNIFGHHL